MDIEILEAGNMCLDGNYLLKALPNESLPILDLVVRESIQNSLDAALPNSDCVYVAFNVGEFSSKRLSKHFDKITDKLDRNYNDNTCQYLSIRDEGTYGLTGELSKDRVKNNVFGNLVKLVYDFGKPQSEETAGGSWGVGKTIFYRVGIGLVIYYSRIYNEKTKCFDSRLAACMVERTDHYPFYIPAKNGNSRSGIAWWGKKETYNKEKTIPLTQDYEINPILDIFNITPFKGSQTGTIVIIPYIDEENLVKDNVYRKINFEQNSSEINSEEQIPSWCNHIDDYLNVSIQKWYYARLNNKYYKYKRYLRASVNGEFIEDDVIAPIFLYLRALYNRAALQNNLPKGYSDIITLKKKETFFKEINVMKSFSINSTSGWLTSIKLSRNDLGMCRPDNNRNPYDYFGIDNQSDVENAPILAFCRKPGMTVSYAQSVGKGSNWLNNVPSTDPDNYIICQFVLNSDNELVDDSGSLEKYIRSVELADHYEWNDIGGRVIIAKIQKNVSNALKGNYQVKTATPAIENSGLGTLLGGILMPPQGFGKSPIGETGGGNHGRGRGGNGGGNGGSGGKGKQIKSKKGYSVTWLDQETVYKPNAVTYVYKISSKKQPSADININLLISSESGDIKASEWVSMGLEMPFEITNAEIKLEDINGHKNEDVYNVDFDNLTVKDDVLSMELLIEDSDDNFYSSGISINFDGKLSYAFKLYLTIGFNSRDQRPSINFL